MSQTFQDLPLFRTSDPETSRQVRRSSVNSQSMVLLAFYAKTTLGLTDEQAAQRAEEAEYKINGYWKRCSDLRRAGLIEDTGIRRTLSSGASGMVCVITDEGLRVAGGQS